MWRSMMWAWLVVMPSPPAMAETLRLQGVFAATAREASVLPTVGVALFEGPLGNELGTAIERWLAELGNDGTPHARVIAPLLRPDGLLDGRTAVSVQDDPWIETRRRCIEKDKDRKCIRRENYDVRCLTRTVSLRADLRMTRRRDGRIVYAAAKSRLDRDEWCEDGGILSPTDGILRSMTESIAREVRLDLAPHREDYAIRVREERAGLSRTDADRVKVAVRLTKRDQTAACHTFAALGDAAPDHGPTLFNRALCAEAAGRYAEASSLYIRARVFGPGFGGDVTRGLDRVASLTAGAEDLRRMAAR